MKIILIEKVEGLGEKGDIVEVKDGYARNYLIPKKLALDATPSNLRAFEAEKRIKALKAQRKKEMAEKLAKKLARASVTIAVRVGEEDKIFGSVGVNDVLEAFKKKGVVLEKGWIKLEEPIKELGTFKVPVKLHPEVETTVKVQVVKQE